MVQFCVVVFNSEICVKYRYVSKIKLVKYLAKPLFFFSSKHTNSPYRAAKLISMTKCRTMNKMVANTKDCRCLQLPSHLQNHHYFALQLLSCNYGQRHHLHLYFTKHKAVTRIGSKGWARQLTSLDIISLSLILNSFPASASGIFLKEKKKFLDGQF